MPRPHPPEFRQRAVDLAREGTKSIGKIAADIGISQSCLRRWVEEAEIDGGRREGLTTEERAELVQLRRENRVLRMEKEILGKPRPSLLPRRITSEMTFRFVDAQKANYPTTMLCRVLAVSTSGFYEWRLRRDKPSKRAKSNKTLTEKIKKIHADSRGTYGSPRVHAELRLGEGLRVGRKRGARLMRLEGIQGVYARRRRGCTRRDLSAQPSADLVKRNFLAQGPDQLWVSDISEHLTDEGKVYVAVVLDAYSRRVVGWSIADHIRSELVVDALQMAIWSRQPEDGKTICHSDHGAQLGFKGWSQHCLIEMSIAVR